MTTRTETGAKRYFAGRSNEAAYADTYRDARRRIDRIDHLIQDLDQRREAVGMTKAELARRSDLTPEVVRRLFTVTTRARVMKSPRVSSFISRSRKRLR